MAIVKKEKFLKDIAMQLGRRTVHFEEEDRPSLMMGGRRVYVAAVGYDFLLGGMAYSVSNARGDILPSSHGVRQLGELDVKSLLAVKMAVDEYSRLRRERTRNLVNIESRMRQTSKKSVKRPSL